MPDHVDPADSILKFTRGHKIFGGILDCLRRASCLVSSAFGYSFELISLPGNHSFVAMASMDPIDISSTDSDSDLREIDNYRDESPARDTESSINSRILPAWTHPTHSNLTGYNGVSRKESSSSMKRIVHDELSSRPQKRPNIGETVGASTSRMDGNVYQKTGSNNSGWLVASHEIHSSHQPLKRALPASFQPSTSNVRSNNIVENVGAGEIRETYGMSSQNAAWPNFSNGKNIMKENFIRASGNDSLLHEKKGNRLLPLSLMPGKHSSATPFVGSNDSFHSIGIGEERPAGADERFVFQAAVQDLHQPKVEATLPDGLLSVSLLRHQKIALAWMLSKESSGLCLGGILADDQGLGKTVSMIALIQMQRALEAKSKAKDLSTTRTEALNLDDDDGGGGCIALYDANQIKESDDFTILPQASNTIKGFHSRRPTAGTLIVCPASVLRQWARELDEKVTDEAKLSVLIYHGGNRTKDPAALAKYDAVLTTYSIVTNEVPKQPLVEEDDDEQKDGERYGLSSAFSMEKKRKKSSANKKSKKGKNEIDMPAFDSSSGTLAKVKWSRVVLDESQTIKNHRTQVARACCSLRAKRRWCLSGTPIQNSVDELFSYFRFLRYDPYDKYKTFGSSIKALISRDSVKGYKKLQVVLRNIMLRRTKGTLIDGEPIINLPPKRVHLTRVEFSSEERTFYDKLETDSRQQFKAYAAAGTVNQNYANILLMLLRLRQACDHPLLVKGLSSDPVGKVSSQMAKMLPRELLVNLLKQLETSLAICLVCRDPPENAVVTMCGHVFCYQCVSDYLTGEDNTCPAPECKEQLGADIVYSRSTLRRCISDDTDGDTPVSNELDENSTVLKSNYISSKIKSALEILKSHCISKNQSSELYDLVRYDGDASSSGGLYLDSESREPEKAIVFSQWTSMLDLVEKSLKNSCINYRRLDGTMSIAARDKAVKDFNADPEVDVMLMSLKAGNLGLNMVAACRVILLDLWWNPTTEDQAVDRAHRIGQTRPVTVSRLTIKNTVEDRILSLQEEKRKMVASAFGEDQSGGHATRLTVEDLRFLFEGR
ncbi:Helicase-like transcription factor HLTF/DNA helicase RAD5, DEAD-box superfamily [Handroanthus impetiginosus]|uniref:Helicase-like transcription factor HLTF/DNA helicase RAD5, DEAD-box superfamily n=1 Tax=Handroanthus impetiginosus TaxID=429701 RepID=A0A2G9GK45_9LAMI|nr:Helicase-like transcription factor HLTF/DNA helicase RAD5, DEAD-box superfamily [Handroanthus impetiginosus]